MIKKAKASYFYSKFQEYSKDKKPGPYLILRKGHSVPDIFTNNNQTFVESSEIAEGFNDFFVNVVTFRKLMSLLKRI